MHGHMVNSFNIYHQWIGSFYCYCQFVITFQVSSYGISMENSAVFCQVDFTYALLHRRCTALIHCNSAVLTAVQYMVRGLYRYIKHEI